MLMNLLVVGNFIVTFMVGALVRVSNVRAIEKALNTKKDELNLNGEIKWTKVTGNYLDKYIEMINLFFTFIKSGKIKFSNPTPFKNKVKFSFYLDDLPCSENQKNSLKRSLYRYNHELKQNNIEITEIVEIDSKKTCNSTMHGYCFRSNEF